MSRHFGVLPNDYCEMLSEMSLKQLAAEAAMMRADGKRCGTATALILRFAEKNVCRRQAGVKKLRRLYASAWQAQKAARQWGWLTRPELNVRPVTGPKWGGPRAQVPKRVQHASFSDAVPVHIHR